MTPRVWNKRDGRTPADAVYIGRPSKWGNPFSHQNSVLGVTKVKSREDAIHYYREWLLTTAEGHALMEAARRELRGKHLVCWCKPEACHGDLLLDIANDYATAL